MSGEEISGEEIKDTVKAKYGQAATRVLGGGQGGSCGCPGAGGTW